MVEMHEKLNRAERGMRLLAPTWPHLIVHGGKRGGRQREATGRPALVVPLRKQAAGIIPQARRADKDGELKDAVAAAPRDGF